MNLLLSLSAVVSEPEQLRDNFRKAVWVYDHTKSLLVVILMHASLVAAQFLLFPAALTGMTALAAIPT